MAFLLAYDACLLDGRVEGGAWTVVFHEQEVAWGATLKSGLSDSSVIVVVTRARDVVLDCASDLAFNLALGRRMKDCILVLRGFYRNILTANTLQRSAGAELPQPRRQVLTRPWRR